MTDAIRQDTSSVKQAHTYLLDLVLSRKFSGASLQGAIRTLIDSAKSEARDECSQQLSDAQADIESLRIQRDVEWARAKAAREAVTDKLDRRHFMAEHTSRYDLRCTRCGRRAMDSIGGETCPESDYARAVRAARSPTPTSIPASSRLGDEPSAPFPACNCAWKPGEMHHYNCNLNRPTPPEARTDGQ